MRKAEASTRGAEVRTIVASRGKRASGTFRACPEPSTVSRRGAVNVAERNPSSTDAWATSASYSSYGSATTFAARSMTAAGAAGASAAFCRSATGRGGSALRR